jgi:hypothetical protein
VKGERIKDRRWEDERQKNNFLLLMLNFKFKTNNSEFTTNQPINFFDFDL